ncbi:hypothetical protein GCM10022243_47410 [Saccharothrix violaceirubra]|uniref:Uncharacterized protein n=1 Tax=Saccharothrix violaceirubra TaxID=413306 RepID=A0A7W7T6Z2_9PSEU|nr:hypothetical protein [Saccharothrix violaceirubra]MBB4967718.1 hypothetical protein [Saccharothrix violaceirubra]
MDADPIDELRRLLDVAADRFQPWLNRLAAEEGHDPGACGWCPVCNVAAVLKGDRSELAAKAAEHVVGLIAVLRAALDRPPAAAEDSPGPPHVQHIPVVRRC